MTVGHILFPLCDTTRHKVLYNIKKRTHPLLQWLILVKLTLLVECFLNNGYHSLFMLPWYSWVVIAGLYLFTVGPSILIGMYFLVTLQRQIKEGEFYKALPSAVRCLLMGVIFLSLGGITASAVYIPKGIYLYFAMSAVTIVEFISSCKTKQYSFGRVLFYDVTLTLLLTLFGLFTPSLNFTPLTYKDFVVFWNYYIGLHVFGIIAARNCIKMEITEEVYVEEFSEVMDSGTQPVVASQSERRE